MSTETKKYCLDTNVLIEAWNKYYSPTFCPEYWNILNLLGEQGLIFIPQMVYDEIVRTEDDLARWLKTSKIPIIEIDGKVTQCLKTIYDTDGTHKQLVDSTKNRSLADPWVIAHAMKELAVVVTKEIKITALNAKRIRIPNVCENMGIRWINDFEMIRELNIKFHCAIIPRPN